MTDDTQFHDKMIAGLARVEEQVIGTNKRLDSMNGSVARLFATVDDVKEDLVRHQVDCPMRSRIEDIQLKLSTGSYPGSSEVRKDLESFKHILFDEGRI